MILELRRLRSSQGDGHRPNNVLGGIPTIALDYSPAWDAQLYEWTDDAIKRGYRGRLREEFQSSRLCIAKALLSPCAISNRTPESHQET
jgi:hypothetical protein